MKSQSSIKAVGDFLIVAPKKEEDKGSGFIIKESAAEFKTGTVVSSTKEDIKEGDTIKYTNEKTLDTQHVVVEYKFIVAVTN